MKIVIYLLLPVLLIACHSKQELEIYKKNKVLVDNKNCDISFYYPYIKESKIDTATTSELNRLLYLIPDYNFYSQRCDETNNNKNIIKGDYNVLQQNDSILSIEYTTVLNYYYGNIQDTIYHSLVLNYKSINENKIKRYWTVSPEELIPNFDRSKLKPYVERYNTSAKRPANILAYENGSNYAITWGITKDEFIIYVAGEGEAHGFEKIVIPLNEIRK